MPFFAVAKGRTPGVYVNWGDAEAQVKGFSGARYKKFDTAEDAQHFITSIASHNTLPKNNSDTNKPQNYPSKSINNQKRSYSKTSNNASSSRPPSGYNKQSNYQNDKTESDKDEFSDGSDELNTILTKQLDDEEKRLKDSEKNIDKDMKKGTKSSNSVGRKDIIKQLDDQKKRLNDYDKNIDKITKKGTKSSNSVGRKDLKKQLDDQNKRLKDNDKNIDKIIKKGTKSSNSVGRKDIMIDPPQPKRKRFSREADFETDNDGYVQVYTDGACLANGRRGAKAGLGIYWGDAHPLNSSEPVLGRATHNCAEIQAATKAIKVALQNGVTKLSINTGSKFLINSVTKWMPGWKRNGWKLKSGQPVKNEIDFKDLDSVQNSLDIKWNYVKAQAGIHGNEMADQLAKAGAALYQKKKVD